MTAYRQDAKRRRQISLQEQEAALVAKSSAAMKNVHQSRRTLQAAPRRSSTVRAALRSPSALRDAFVLKEILDKPVALRDPLAEGAVG